MKRFFFLTCVALVSALCTIPASATHTMTHSSKFGATRFLIVPLTGHRSSAISTAALFHTLFNDFITESDGTTYVRTGDIPAMWLRDAAAQTIPYMRFQRYFPVLRERFAGVVERGARDILKDPYANAFTSTYGIWERKWEVDSLAAEPALAWTYWTETADHTMFTHSLHDALRTIVSTYRCEQQHATCSHYTYPFGHETSYNYAGHTGLIWSAFRPSDDAVRYHYNIPQQMLAVVALEQIAALARDGYADTALAVEAHGLALAVESGIQHYGRYYDFSSGWMYVYETDAEGHFTRMDDANMPDLLGMPYYQYRSSRDPVYLNTREYVLSPANPYYYRGRYAMGLGSPHTPRGWVWPLGIITRGLTATSSVETAECITILSETDSEEFLIHESFDPNAYWRYTRAEFGWANAFYAELIFRSVAGFKADGLSPPGYMLGLAAPVRTPTLTSPIEQLENQGRLVSALGELLYLLR